MWSWRPPGGTVTLTVEFRRGSESYRAGVGFGKVRACRFRAEGHCTAWHVEGAYVASRTPFRLTQPPPAHAVVSPVGLSHSLVTMTLMSELPAEDGHDVIHRGGQVVAVVVPIEEYRQLRLALEEQRVNEEFDAARASYLARQEAGAVRYVSHEEARRRLGQPAQ